MRFSAVFMSVSLASVGGCVAPANNEMASGGLAQITELREELRKLKSDREQLQTSLNGLRTQVFAIKNSLSRFATATFDPVTGQGFQRVDTALGTVVVSVQNIEAYGNGVKVRLSVGNLTSATLSDLSGSAKYGATEPPLDFSKDESIAKYNEWFSSLKEAPLNLTRDLDPASWNNVVVTLPAIKTGDFGHLEVTLDAAALKLRKGT